MFEEFRPVARFSCFKRLTHESHPIAIHQLLAGAGDPPYMATLCFQLHRFCCFFQQLLSPSFFDGEPLPHFLKESIGPKSGPQPASKGPLSDHIFPDCIVRFRLTLLYPPAVLTVPAKIYRMRRVTLFRHTDAGSKKLKLFALHFLSHMCLTRRGSLSPQLERKSYLPGYCRYPQPSPGQTRDPASPQFLSASLLCSYSESLQRSTS